MIIHARDGEEVQIDADDLALLCGKQPRIDVEGYPSINRYDGRRTMTRLQVLLLGKQPRGRCVDHINGDKTDNRRANLRVVGWKENQINRKRLNKNNTSGVRGVVFNASKPKPWKAQIHVDYRGIHLGWYATKDEAVAVRQAAERQYFGASCPTSEVAA